MGHARRRRPLCPRCPPPRVPHPPLQRRAWIGRRPARQIRRDGRDLVLHPLHRPEPVAMGAPQPAQAPHRPPDHDAGSYWRSGNLPRMARAPLSPPPVRARYQHLGPADSGLAVRAHGGRHRSEGLERALQRQINPHFLFNTLNSITALVRSQPELAREMTVKLANILRALLKDHDTYVPLREELSFTDDYIDIEAVRFGTEKLRVEKDIDPRTLDVLVPSILLQPLIENSIKHGLEPRVHGGTVTLRSRLQGDRVMIEVADDGVGIVARPTSELRR